jgi:hypothetical protein
LLGDDELPPPPPPLGVDIAGGGGCISRDAWGGRPGDTFSNGDAPENASNGRFFLPGIACDPENICLNLLDDDDDDDDGP